MVKTMKQGSLPFKSLQFFSCFHCKQYLYTFYILKKTNKEWVKQSHKTDLSTEAKLAKASVGLYLQCKKDWVVQ